MEKQCTLWKLVLKGDQKAYRQFVGEYFSVLFNYGHRFSEDHELIKDTIQELFITIWEKRNNLSNDVNVKAYLLSSFRRALHRKIKPHIRMVSLKEQNLQSFDIRTCVEERFIKNESSVHLAKTISDLLNNLPDRQKEVIYLKYFLDLSRQEISETLGIVPQTVSNIIQMALKNLKISWPAK